MGVVVADEARVLGRVDVLLSRVKEELVGQSDNFIFCLILTLVRLLIVLSSLGISSR